MQPRGGTLVAPVADTDRAQFDAALDQSAVNLRERSAAWQKSGWNTFDPASKPYGAEERSGRNVGTRRGNALMKTRRFRRRAFFQEAAGPQAS